jgi:SAM-dependent methyltransferase
VFTQKVRVVRSLGLASTMVLVGDRLLRRRSPLFTASTVHFAGVGLEIGGPSKVFSASGYWPAYETAERVDNVNFRDRTAWHGTVEGGEDNFCFHPGKASGTQFIRDASDLHGIAEGRYDFLLSSHMLEHSANPMKVLHAWKRVLKPGGWMQLVLPHMEGTFDHRRAVTTLEHLQADFDADRAEDDRTHFDEILRLHDLSRDLSQASADSFRAWILDNAANRGAHHHVFTSLLAARLVDAVGFEILALEPRRPQDIFLTARKPTDGAAAAADNARYLAAQAEYLRRSPFKVDRQGVG